MIGIHPNTVRLYEVWGFIPKPLRKANGYRIFSDVHIDQFRLARTALQIPVIQNGLRTRMIEVIKLSAQGQYDNAIALTNEYIAIADAEIANANEAAEIANTLLKCPSHDPEILYKRKEVSDILGITMDTLRNWEMNGLLKIKRKENGYRIYDSEAINKLKMIRSLRCANYSLSSILRMMNAISQNESADAKQILNTTNSNEEIISVCDTLIMSLHTVKENAEIILEMLHDMRCKNSNPPL